MVQPMNTQTDTNSVERGADAIYRGYLVYQSEFKDITRRAQSRFEERDWIAAQKDAAERLDLYRLVLTKVVEEIYNILGADVKNRSIWATMKVQYTRLIEDREDCELAETFFNSVTRRIFTTVGVDPLIEYVASEFQPCAEEPTDLEYVTHHTSHIEQRLIKQMLINYQFNVAYRDIDEDAKLVADGINAYLQKTWGDQRIDGIDIIKAVFYRNKGAYIVGRIHKGSEMIPLVLPLLNTEEGIVVDAVLLTEAEASVVFSFTHSYFHVEVERPRQLTDFLQSIMPSKPLAEIYISVGYHKHGKTELYRALLRHLDNSNDTFVIAPGERGMVMTVFTLSSYDIVFKIIKDKFAYPKTTTRQDVMQRYQLVFKHDRAGRLVDAQEFEYLKFDKDRFDSALLEELLQVAGSTVSLEGDDVIIKHLYTERRLTPLNLYVKEADEAFVDDVVIDYGKCVKELTATNVFPGDILLKNFGVTRNGRVVFYDYDELCLLTDCIFRKIPPARDDDDEFSSEPWYFVGETDVFPEEYRTFLGLGGHLRDVFIEHHGDLFEVEFWSTMQAKHRAGEVLDIFPYKESKRLARDRR
jgi:isocitrate dehydrogenase kinase/phosphatase